MSSLYFWERATSPGTRLWPVYFWIRRVGRRKSLWVGWDRVSLCVVVGWLELKGRGLFMGAPSGIGTDAKSGGRDR